MTSIKHGTNRWGARGNSGGGGPDAGPWDRVGTVVQLDNIGDTVAVGAASMFGSEKVRIVGNLRVEGQVLGNSIRTEDTSGGTTAFMEYDGGSTAAISVAGEGRIRFNEVTMAFEVSEDGGAYTPLFTPSSGGWTDDGLIVRLTTSTDDVVIGGIATVGGERLRVLGAVLFEGEAESQSQRIDNGSAAFLEMANGSAAALSAGSEGRFRYNSSTQQFEVSENGGAYTGLVTDAGPWDRSGTVVRLDTPTDDVVIGAAGMSGTETLRQTGGAVLFNGTAGAVPVAGAGTRLLWAPAKSALRAGSVTGSQWDDANVGAGSAAFGLNTQAGGLESFAVGSLTQAPAARSAAFGISSVADRLGQIAHANGQFAAAGDSQSSILALRRQTSDATPADLTLDGSVPSGAVLNTSNRIILEDDTTYVVTVDVVARNTGSSEHAGWELKAVVKRDAGAATTSLVGTQMKTTVAKSAPAAATWDANILVDVANGALRVEGSGQAAKTINWTARLTLTEVSG